MQKDAAAVTATGSLDAFQRVDTAFVVISALPIYVAQSNIMLYICVFKMFTSQPIAVLSEVKNHSYGAEESCLSRCSLCPCKAKGVFAVIAEGTLPLSC